MAPARKTAKKTTTKKTAAKRTTAAKKTTARKTAAKKTTTRKTATKRPAAKKATKRTAAKTPAVTTLKHIAADMAEEHEMSKKDAEMFLSEFIETIGDKLRRGEKIRLSGLGIFQVRNRPARMGRNPATGESIRIKASKKVAFRVAKDLKDSI